jgi:DNA adenine methylase
MAINELHLTGDPIVGPPLKWAGGKRWIVQHILPFWLKERHRRLVEPFCGGLAVTLGLRPDRALLNDINPHLINFYKQLKRGLKFTLPAENDESFYYKHRERFNELIKNGRSSGPEAAQLFYYLNRTGYNGLCRFNRSGYFNVPFGRYSRINYSKDFLQYKHVFKHWDFENVDFEQLQTELGDFIYADPPYDVEFTSYSSGGFGWADQVRTAQWLSKHRGPVILSNQATEKIRELYGDFGFSLKFFDAPRRISCNGDRTAALEVLAIRGLEWLQETREPALFSKT